MLKIWFMAMRPWSFTASFVPVALGAALAWTEGSFDLGLFLLTVAGGTTVHAGTNLINTYGDYMSGVDTVESAVTNPQLVTGVIKPESMKRAGIGAFALASAVGLVLTYLCGWPVLAVGCLGVIAGYGYTAGVWPYKYKGLGSIFVFFLMGPLMVWPAYYIQTGKFSLAPVLVSLPVAMLVAAILHANDIRDVVCDRAAGIRTLALNIGTGTSLLLYDGLLAGAYLCLVVLVAAGILPAAALLALLTAPVAVGLVRSAREGVDGSLEKMQWLEANTAGFHFKFGLLMIAGMLVHPYLGRWLGQ
jgi:1,4-dihydroxy-2-naphthoate octaprenyltransferase